MNNLSRRILKGTGVVLAVLVVLIIGLVIFAQFTWDKPVSREVRQMNAPTDPETVARGEFLYKDSLICWDCHASQGAHGPDAPQAGGQEFDLTDVGVPGGFGYVYAANLTSDPETGIGNWTDGEIVRALREGLDPEGNLLFPIMEAEMWHGLSDEDALALVAYLRTLYPVRNEVPPNRLTIMAKALIALGVVKSQPSVTEPVVAPPRGPTVEYGEYLAWRVSGCSGCHTPRSPQTGQYDFSQPLAGGLFPFAQGLYETTGSNLTPDPATGIGDWTEDQFITAMRTGLKPEGTVMVPFMPWPSYSGWDTDDLRAVWLYLRSLDPVEHQVPETTLKGVAATGSGVDRGEALYEVYCLICHGERGTGAPFTTVPLREVASGIDDATLARFITEGVPGTSMPSWGKTLSEDQLQDVIAVIRTW